MEASPTKPLGRLHIRAKGGINQTNSKMIGLWTMPTKPGTTLNRLQQAFVTGFETIDKIEAKASEHSASGPYTPAGAKQATQHSTLTAAVPAPYRHRHNITLATAT